MSDAGMDMLFDMPLSTRSDSPTVATGHTAMQLDIYMKSTLTHTLNLGT